MPVTTIYPTTHFIRAYQTLPQPIQAKAKQKEQTFKANPFDPRLKTHKLKGKLEGYWSFSITYQYRILFRFINHQTVLYHDIGTHDVYR